MKNKTFVLRTSFIIIAVCVAARITAIMSTILYTSGVSTFLYVISDYLYISLDALLLGASIAAIAASVDLYGSKFAGKIVLLLSAVYTLDSVFALVWDVAAGAIHSFDPNLHVYPLLVATFYRIILYLISWLAAYTLLSKNHGSKPARSQKHGFLHSVSGAALLSVGIVFAVDFFSEVVYALNFAIDCGFYISSSELSSMIGQFVTIILSRALIPALSTEAYFALIHRKNSKEGNI